MYPKLFLVMRGIFHFRWILAILLGLMRLHSIGPPSMFLSHWTVLWKAALNSDNRWHSQCPVSWGVRSMSVDWEVPWNSYYICAKIGGEQLSSKRNAWKSQFSDYVATGMERVNRNLLAAWNETYGVTLTFVFCKGQYIWAYRSNRQERGCLTGSETSAM